MKILKIEELTLDDMFKALRVEHHTDKIMRIIDKVDPIVRGSLLEYLKKHNIDIDATSKVV